MRLHREDLASAGQEVGEAGQFCAFLMGVEVWVTPDLMVDMKEFLIWVSEQHKSLKPNVLRCEEANAPVIRRE